MTTGGFRVRDAEAGDLPAVQAIYAHHVLHGSASFEEEAPDVDEMRRRWEGIRAAGYPYLVAVRDGRIVGYAYASTYRTRRAYRFTVENSVYVDTEVRASGVGSALLAEVIVRCEEGPWRQMIAVIGDSGNAASIGLHKKFGFREVGVLKAVGFKHGHWVDSVLMQRALGDGATTDPVERMDIP